MSFNIKESAKDLAKTTMFVKEHSDDLVKQSREFGKQAFFNYSDLKDKVSNLSLPELNNTQKTAIGAGVGAAAGGIGMPLLQSYLSSGKEDNSSSLTTALLGGILGAGAGGGLAYLASKSPTNIKVKRGNQSATLMPNQINKAWNAEKALEGEASSTLTSSLGESGLVSTPISIGVGTAGLAGLNELLPFWSGRPRPLRDTLFPGSRTSELLKAEDTLTNPLVERAINKAKLNIGDKLTAADKLNISPVLRSIIRKRGLVGLAAIASALGIGKLGLSLSENRRLSDLQNNVKSKLEES